MHGDQIEPVLTWLNLEIYPVSYTHLRAHETKANLVCRLLLEKLAKQRIRLFCCVFDDFMKYLDYSIFVL